MFAGRRILALAGLAVVIGVLAGVANAEPKNQWPFTRTRRPAGARPVGWPVDRRRAPRPEAKNELPFTRFVGTVATTKSDRHGASALTLSGGGAGGIDGRLMAWIAVAAAILTGGALVFLRSMRLTTQRPV